MRIWDVEPEILCRSHLLGEHRELHAIWSVLTNGKAGYAKHPETVRWHGRLAALHERHEKLVQEMTGRGYRHNSPLDLALATGERVQSTYVDTLDRQRQLLKAKGCDCRV